MFLQLPLSAARGKISLQSCIEAFVKEEEYETIPKATLKFEGCKGECQWTDIKVRHPGTFNFE